MNVLNDKNIDVPFISCRTCDLVLHPNGKCREGPKRAVIDSVRTVGHPSSPGHCITTKNASELEIIRARDSEDMEGET